MVDEELEKLLKIAQQKAAPKKRELSDAEKFCYTLRYLPGDELIPASMIYEHYKRWKVPKVLDHPSKFFKDLKRVLQQKKLQYIYCYLVDVEGLSNEFIKEAQDLIKEKRQAAEAKKIPRRKSSTSEDV